MNRLKAAVLHTGGKLEKQNMIWNMIGSFCYAFASMVLSFPVMRIMGKELGGDFAFAFSTFGQQMFLVAYFGIRPFHVTDDNQEFSFGDYFRHRLITCGAAILVAVGYLLVTGYTPTKTAVIFLMVLYKVIDGFADVYESEFQRNGNLHLTGKSNTFRTIVSVTCFLCALVMTEQLVFSCAVAVVAQAAGVLVFDSTMIRALSGIDHTVHKGSSRILFHSTLLLFISVFLDFYIFSAAKYAINDNLASAASGYFNAIFMPTSVINLVAGFVIRPFLTDLTKYWNHRRFEDLKQLVGKLAVVIGGLTLLATGGCWLLGRPVLQVMELILGSAYAGTLIEYRGAFTAIVLGGGFYAFMNLLYYVLVIMRKQRQIFVVYGAVAVAAWFLSQIMVRQFGINGAAYSYLILMILLSAGFGLLTLLAYKKGKNAYEA